MPPRRAQIFEGVAMVPVMRVRVQASGRPIWDDTRETVPISPSVAAGRVPPRNGAGSACPMGQLRIGNGFPKWNERNLPPDFVLKVGPSKMERNRKFCSLPTEVFLDLCAGLFQDWVFRIKFPIG